MFGYVAPRRGSPTPLTRRSSKPPTVRGLRWVPHGHRRTHRFVGRPVRGVHVGLVNHIVWHHLRDAVDVGGRVSGVVAALDPRLVSETPPGSVEPESRGLGAGPVCGLKSTPPPQRGTCSTRERGASSGGRHCLPAARKSGFRSKTGHPQDARERRGWDSNPRCPFRHAGFQDRCIQPLCHLSVGQILTPARPAWPVQRSHDRCLGVSGIPVI